MRNVMPDIIPCPLCRGRARRVGSVRGGLHRFECARGHSALRSPDSIRMTERLLAELDPDGPGPGSPAPTVA